MNANTDNPEVSYKEMSVERGLTESLTELRDALRSGEPIQKRFTMRTVELNLEPQDYSPEEIRELREELKVSQAVFAQLLGVKPRTIQSWEQGLQPPPIARRLLDLMREDIGKWRAILERGAKGDGGSDNEKSSPCPSSGPCPIGA